MNNIFPSLTVSKWISNNKECNNVIWQINWIGNNIDRYEGVYHANCVAMNIIHNHQDKEFKKLYKNWKDRNYMKDIIALQDFIDNQNEE